MKTFDTPADAREAIMDFRASPSFAALTEDLQTKFKQKMASPSPVDQIMGVMELMYASRDQVDDVAKDLIGGLAAYATINAWHGLGENNRGNMIVQAMRRDLGERPPTGVKFQKPEDDASPKPEYIQQDIATPTPPSEVPADQS